MHPRKTDRRHVSACSNSGGFTAAAITAHLEQKEMRPYGVQLLSFVRPRAQKISEGRNRDESQCQPEHKQQWTSTKDRRPGDKLDETEGERARSGKCTPSSPNVHVNGRKGMSEGSHTHTQRQSLFVFNQNTETVRGPQAAQIESLYVLMLRSPLCDRRTAALLLHHGATGWRIAGLASFGHLCQTNKQRWLNS